MLMESDDWQSPFLDSWSELTTSDAIEEAESDDVLQQNMQGFGKTAQRIAGRLRYNPWKRGLTFRSRSISKRGVMTI